MALPVIKPLSQRSLSEKDSAKLNDKAMHAVLKKLSRRPGNDSCADCGVKQPGWAVLPHGVFVCIDCAQVHRGIGTHISRVKSSTSGTYLWFADEIAAMATMGNRRANKLYLGSSTAQPRQGACRAEVAQHIKHKYVELRWFNPSAAPAESVAPQAEQAPASLATPLSQQKSGQSARGASSRTCRRPKQQSALGARKVGELAEAPGEASACPGEPGAGEIESATCRPERHLPAPLEKQTLENRDGGDDKPGSSLDAFELHKARILGAYQDAATSTPVDFFAAYGL